MHSLKRLLFIERKRNLDWWAAVVMFILCVMTVAVVSRSSRGYKKMDANLLVARAVAEVKFQLILNYDMYNAYGVSSKFKPSPLTVFFAPVSKTSEMSGNVNALFRLKVDFSAKGVHALNRGTIFNSTFRDIVFYILPIVFLWAGFEAFKNKKFSRLLAVSCGKRNVFFRLWGAPLIEMTVFMLCLFLLGLASALVEGLIFRAEEYVYYALFFICAWVLVLLPCVTAGAFVGGVLPKKVHTTALIVLYVFSFIVVPAVVNTLAEIPENTIPSSEETEYGQGKILKDFEKGVLKKYGPFKESIRHLYALEAERRLMVLYPKKEEVLENKLREEIVSAMRLRQKLSCFFPTCFFSSTCHEISSRGYGNYDLYYRHLQELKREFLYFWTDRVFYCNPKKIVKYLSAYIDVYEGKSGLPPYFWWGFLFQLLLNAAFVWFCNLRVRKALYSRERRELNYENVHISLKVSGLYSLFTSSRGDLTEQVFNVFTGRGGALEERVLIGGKTFGVLSDKRLSYLPGPENFPGFLIIKDLITFLAELLDVPNGDIPGLREDIRRYLAKSEAERTPRPENGEADEGDEIDETALAEKMPERRLNSFPMEDRAFVIMKIYAKTQAKFFFIDDFLKEVEGTEPQLKEFSTRTFLDKKTTVLDFTSVKNPLLNADDAGNYSFHLDKRNKYHQTSSPPPNRATKKKKGKS